MIPKIIHYCWVGGAPKPKSVLYCIESWKKYCPDYEIREWNEENYDFFKNTYMRQAYEAKKWGFVPDYARLDIVYQYGGIYLDTDVEIVKNFDELLEENAFMGFENTGDGEFFVNCGHGFGAEAHHKIIGAVRDWYDQVQFLNTDGTYNLLPSPHYTTQALKKYGLIQENKDQSIPGMLIYASDVFCPKNFRTGEICKTSRTVSIHHFSASWMDENIRNELKHIQRIDRTFGSKIGKIILLGESVLEKYTPKELVTKLPKKIAQKAKKRAIASIECIPYYKGLFMAMQQPDGDDAPILLDTSLESDNCGDQIIMECCENQLQDFIDCKCMKKIPTHRFATQSEQEDLKKASYKILCGTNILSGNMKSYGLWRLTADISPYKNTVLMGVGFNSFSTTFDKYTQRLLQTILSKNKIHSVRDSFSEQLLHNMGIKNVLNTGCPTMWGLTPEHCAKIPTSKATNVICTLTDYCRDETNDRIMMDILLENYQKVYFWIQGEDDLEYIHMLGYENRVSCISSTLSALDYVLEQKDLDYVGTRLHAGIRALSAGHRSIVISIDNRAKSISVDTGLPIILREDIPISLKEKIHSDFKTEIKLNDKNIRLWKGQFAYEKNKSTT